MIYRGKATGRGVYWDQAAVLVQLGLLERSMLPVSGADEADVCSSSGRGAGGVRLVGLDAITTFYRGVNTAPSASAHEKGETQS
jgi:hypothetical protein